MEYCNTIIVSTKNYCRVCIDTFNVSRNRNILYFSLVSYVIKVDFCQYCSISIYLFVLKKYLKRGFN